jgi:hypothetical protein
MFVELIQRLNRPTFETSFHQNGGASVGLKDFDDRFLWLVASNFLLADLNLRFACCIAWKRSAVST